MPNQKSMDAMERAEKLETYILRLGNGGSIIPVGHIRGMIADELESFGKEKVKEDRCNTLDLLANIKSMAGGTQWLHDYGHMLDLLREEFLKNWIRSRGEA